MYFLSHSSDKQYFSSQKIDENVVFLATTHDKSGLTRRELPCVVTRNETLSGYRNCIDDGDDISGSAWPWRHRSCDAGTPLDHLRLQLVCKKKLIWKRYMYKREITKSNKIAWLSLCFILERSWVALYSDVCQCVRHRCHLTKSPLFPIYTGIQALCWPCTT